MAKYKKELPLIDIKWEVTISRCDDGLYRWKAVGECCDYEYIIYFNKKYVYSSAAKKAWMRFARRNGFVRFWVLENA